MIAVVAVVAVFFLLNQEKNTDMWDILPYIDETPASDFIYEITDEYGGGVMIMGYKGKSDGVRIPETLNGKPVVYVDVSESALKELILPDTVVELKSNNNSLEYINIPLELEGAYLAMCPALKAVYISNGVKKIDDGAFYGCVDLTSVTIPGSVTKIGSKAFENCISLTSVIISDGVTQICETAFYGCYSLSSITIPNSVTEIGGGAFCICTSLTSITIPDSVTKIGRSAFDSSGLTSITIPNSVTEIGESAFNNCPNVTIKCPSGSYAEQYAKENNIPYTLI